VTDIKSADEIGTLTQEESSSPAGTYSPVIVRQRLPHSSIAQAETIMRIAAGY
jgi:hypothetical protein